MATVAWVSCQGLGLCLWLESQSLGLWAEVNSLLRLLPRLLLFSCSVMSDPLRPRGQWSARLLYPRDFSGRNTGVGSHSLLQRIVPIHRSNLHLLHLLHWQADSLPPSYKVPNVNSGTSLDFLFAKQTLSFLERKIPKKKKNKERKKERYQKKLWIPILILLFLSFCNYFVSVDKHNNMSFCLAAPCIVLEWNFILFIINILSFYMKFWIYQGTVGVVKYQERVNNCIVFWLKISLFLWWFSISCYWLWL